MPQDFFGDISPIIDGLNISADDRKFLKTSLWTFEEVTPISNEQEYEKYKLLGQELQKELQSARSNQTKEEYQAAFLAFSRTPRGMLATAIGGRIIEWEEARE